MAQLPTANNTAASSPLLQFFRYEHLKDERLKEISRPICDLAKVIAEALPYNSESTVALRKLLEAKDAAVAAAAETPPLRGEVFIATAQGREIEGYAETRPFVYKHLPENLQEVSEPFYDTALLLLRNLEHSHMRSLTFARLFEAKNAAVRSMFMKGG